MVAFNFGRLLGDQRALQAAVKKQSEVHGLQPAGLFGVFDSLVN